MPKANFVIGAREIEKAARSGKVKRVVAAENCPDFLLSRFQKMDVKIEKFSGDQSQLGTKLGKPFPVAMVGYEE